MAENNNRLNINQDHTRNDEEKALKLSEKEREKFKKELNDINELLEEELNNVMNDVPETTDTSSTEPIISDPNYDPLQIESSYKANAKIIKEQALRQQILTGNDPNKKKAAGND